MRLLMFLSGVALSLASAASADGLYRWTNADGVVSFSDDLKRIPEAYRASAVAVKGEDLAGYKQFTPAPAAETETYRERLNAHADRMRALNESVAAEQAAAKPAPAQGASIGEVRVSRKLSLAMPEGVQAGAEPIVVEEHRVRDGNATTHIYVVRQGDRVLSVMRPHTNQSDATWQDIEEVIGEE